MATTPGRTQCTTCRKEKMTSKCSGCFQDFCYTHLGEHRQELSKQRDGIEASRDLFQETLRQQTTNSQKHPLIQQIAQWEEESIKIIQQTAEEARQQLTNYTNEHLVRMEQKLTQLTHQLKDSREEDDIMETDLKNWKEELQQMSEQLNKPPKLDIQQSSIALIYKIQVEFLPLISTPFIDVNTKWTGNGLTVAGGGQGNGPDQLLNPWSVYVHDDQTIYVADTCNHRIIEWREGTKNGRTIAGGRGPGNRKDQLNYPVKVVMDKENDALIICDYNNRRVVRWPRRDGASGKTIISNVACCDLTRDDNEHLYISDIDKHEVRRWRIGETTGVLIAGGQGMGNRLDQLNQPYHIFVDHDHSVYVSDYGNHRVMKWVEGAKEGIIVAGDQGQGNTLSQLSNPRGIIVDQLGTVYVAEQNNHRVTRWMKEAKEGSVVVGGNGQGAQANQFNAPLGLSFDQQNNLYVVDYNNHRVQKFNIESKMTLTNPSK